MRTVVRKRVIFLILAFCLYFIGFQTIPFDLVYNGSLGSVVPLIMGIMSYFIIIPVLYWYLVIKAGQQKPWKLILIISLSATCARFSFPEFIAEYFDFILWLRYPFLAIILAIELYFIISVIRGIWKARSLEGDPRLHVFEQYKNDEKKLMVSLLMAWEPASWYYAFPRFSKKHISSIGNISLSSANYFHWISLVSICSFLSVVSYFLLYKWNELVALFVSSLILWFIIYLTANYRVSRHYSAYISNDILVLNNGFLGFMTIKLNDILSIKGCESYQTENKDSLFFGKGQVMNVNIKFLEKQIYIGSVGNFQEYFEEVHINIVEPDIFIEQINKEIK
jgi:hypothetical protein